MVCLAVDGLEFFSVTNLSDTNYGFMSDLK